MCLRGRRASFRRKSASPDGAAGWISDERPQPQPERSIDLKRHIEKPAFTGSLSIQNK